MRNASMSGQALPPIEFPYVEEDAVNYSSLWPKYEKRMQVISYNVRVELHVMIESDKQEAELDNGTL